MILYYFVEFAGSFANIALLLLFIGRLFPKKEPVSKWFYVYVVLMIAGQCALSLFPDWVTQRTIYLLVGGFFLALLFYEVRPWQAVFASGAFFTLIALVEVLAMLLIGLRIPDTDILMQAGAARLVYVVFSNLIQVPLVVLISHFFSESLSIRTQKAMLMEYATRNGFGNCQFYVDDGYSGTNSDRPAFQELLDDIREGKVASVITKDQSRLGRNHIETGTYMEIFFPEHGVRYIAINDGYDSK